jgi:hypothetical protein
MVGFPAGGASDFHARLSSGITSKPAIAVASGSAVPLRTPPLW